MHSDGIEVTPANESMHADTTLHSQQSPKSAKKGGAKPLNILELGKMQSIE